VLVTPLVVSSILNNSFALSKISIYSNDNLHLSRNLSASASASWRLVIGGCDVSGKGGVELEALGLSLLVLARMGLGMGLETLIPVLLLPVVGRSVEGTGLVLNNAAESRGSEEDEI